MRILNSIHLPILFRIWFLKTFHYKQYSQISLAVFFSQMRIETSNFTSDLYRNNLNLFGMRLPKKRATTAIGERAKHAVFSSYISAVDDYFLWLKYNKIEAVNDIHFISDVINDYNAEVADSSYKKLWLQIYNQEKKGELEVVELVKKMQTPVFFFALSCLW